MTPVQKLAVLLVAMIMAFGAAWQVQGWRYEKRLAERDAAQAFDTAEAGRLALEEEQRRQSAVNKVGNDARAEIKAATDDASTADAAGDRLHVETSKFAATACGDPGAAQRGASATRAAMVLSELLKRADKRAGELAAAYDRSRIAGLACEQSYIGVTSQ
ncbi:DUF2514 domain-containing protein [Pseudomonas mucidolens]|uniref:DUF2514 domain-containing protein n=1 Tax=Pseudomonas mucidolens TaxID=46679 RepID=A0A1H2ME99_9PSED|nr:DUF2514 domain-containing protein [Pseudomonas mucidolens]SDU91404.1 Protein of unknown function [Pseudomonas mucidolens]SQH34052.1 phage protein [Pseudomonas mucidolens]